MGQSTQIYHSNQSDNTDKNPKQEQSLNQDEENSKNFQQSGNSKPQVQSYDPKDGVQGERALNQKESQQDQQLHDSKQNQSHDPKDGLQGEKNVT